MIGMHIIDSDSLARLQPPAGLIETAMERERERGDSLVLALNMFQPHVLAVYHIVDTEMDEL